MRADVRGAGVGRRLLRASKDAAAARGLAALSLSVEDGNHARHLYESEGFADVPGREADGVMLWRTGTLRITHRLFDPAHLAATGQSREMTRARAAELGHETLTVIERASEPIAHAIAAKRSIPPDEPLPEAPARRFATTAVELTNETTLGAARRLTAVDERPLALNFANGLHPGGGWLSGARAQEEVLCRSSALYATLRGDPMYAAHAARPGPDSTDWVILSPDVPVFRGDDGVALDQPWTLSVITSAAPVAFSIGQPRARDLLARRIRRVLAVAYAHGYTSLVLGAWGCGAFGNDPVRTAADFRTALEESGGTFEHVIFAIPTDFADSVNFSAFAEAFPTSQVAARPTPRRDGRSG